MSTPMDHSPTLTTTQRMADALLDVGLRDFLADARRLGLSYEDIAKRLYVESNGAVSVTYTTVKRWLTDFGLMEEAS